MADANVRIPAEARDRLAERAERAERAEQAEQAREELQACNGYNPDAERIRQLDAELDRRLAEAENG
ncbi:hypothetical protein ACF9IK_36960 [Kitasatospora hibisci]|uniref:hypothetical protein n=1 Tax=Kitasatospora hibisci TaxID=3369522 RepID=UPI0037552830